MIIKDFLDINLTPFENIVLHETNFNGEVKHFTDLRLKDFLTPTQELKKENVPKDELFSKMINHTKKIVGNYWIKNFKFVYNDSKNEMALFIWY